jgi:hypothetical protein
VLTKCLLSGIMFLYASIYVAVSEKRFTSTLMVVEVNCELCGVNETANLRTLPKCRCLGAMLVGVNSQLGILMV